MSEEKKERQVGYTNRLGKVSFKVKLGDHLWTITKGKHKETGSVEIPGDTSIQIKVCWSHPYHAPMVRIKNFKKYIKKGEKISGTGKLARETLIIDKETKKKYHSVKEQNLKGEWVEVHKEDKPFA